MHWVALKVEHRPVLAVVCTLLAILATVGALTLAIVLAVSQG